jgi:predicted ArsR family transcriptional regulator
VPGINLQHQIAAIALLDEPIRRGLYLYVAGRRCDVGRDEAARALRISRALAAFHLDKLVQQGLLDATFRRLTARRGPGAGRPAKLYHRSARQLDFTLPERRYELAGRVFARALTAVAAVAPAARGVLERAARAEGRSLGADARRRAGPVAGTDRLLANALAVLDESGYDPARVNGEVRLRNCPFDALANECRPLVCGMNLALLRGLLAAAGARGTRAELRAPEAGSCCVVLKTSARAKR